MARALLQVTHALGDVFAGACASAREQPSRRVLFVAASEYAIVAALEPSDAMKCHVEFECTPQEARQFLGLPDVQLLQAKVMGEVERKMLAEMDRFSPDGVLKTWLSMYTQAPEQFRDALTTMLNGMSRSKV